MPGIQDVPVTKEQKTERSAEEGTDSLFVSLLAGLFALPQITPVAAAAAGQVSTSDGKGIKNNNEVDKNNPAAGTADSLDLILALAAAGNPAALQAAAPPSVAEGLAASIPAGGQTQASGKEAAQGISKSQAEAAQPVLDNAAATYVLKTSAGQAEIPHPMQVAMSAAAVETAAPDGAGTEAGTGQSIPSAVNSASAAVSAVSPGVVSPSEAGGSIEPIPVAPAKISGKVISEGTPVPAAKGDQPEVTQAFQSSMSSTGVKIDGSLAGNSEGKTNGYGTADVQQVQGDDSQDASTVGVPASSRNAEGAASVRHSAGNRHASELPSSGSSAGTDTNSTKQFSEETAQALKLAAGAAPGRETSGEVQATTAETKNIRTTHETPVVPDGRVAGVDAAIRHDGTQRVHEVVEAPRTIRVQDQVFQVTRVNAGKLEVTVHPEGLGKLDIEVNLNSGQIHARISASDPQTRDMLQRNLPDIMNALAAEGHTVGGFSVGLRDGREQTQQGPAKQQRAEVQKVTAADILPVRSVNNNIVSIFV